MHGRVSREAGFTLLELMVALVAGLVAILAVYYVSSASARHFHEQQRVAQTQTSVRMAMQQLRRDIGRTALFGTPNSERETRCITPPRPVQAIVFQNDVDNAALPRAAANGVSADRLRLTGNFVTSDVYFVSTLAGSGTGAYLQTQWQGFRRDFGNWTAANLPIGAPTMPTGYNAAALSDVFSADRMVHIQNVQGYHFFLDIQNVTANGTTPPLVNFRQSLPIGGTCVGGLADGALIAPISTVEYAVVNPRTDAELVDLLGVGSTAALEQATGRVNSVLVRREINMRDGSTIAGTTRVVLEYVADLNYEFVFDDQTAPGNAPNLVRRDGAQSANLLNGSVAAVPHRVRSVIVRLSARTAGEEPGFPFVAGGPALTRYDVDGRTDAAARIRTLETEIFLPNLAGRNLRP
ncbi:MAG: prepilin-type N-terminal cleavage/methylation domain-containing protein [Sandaracinus sp.]|nr:prepilin-type N-terminal cleavage/methylation domain-containing protein [Sandaracinus sp.]